MLASFSFPFNLVFIRMLIFYNNRIFIVLVISLFSGLFYRGKGSDKVPVMFLKFVCFFLTSEEKHGIIDSIPSILTTISSDVFTSWDLNNNLRRVLYRKTLNIGFISNSIY